jgi:hypothetical protein
MSRLGPKITLHNTFHSTSCRIQLDAGDHQEFVVEQEQTDRDLWEFICYKAGTGLPSPDYDWRGAKARIRRKLCGSRDCKCAVVY